MSGWCKEIAGWDGSRAHLELHQHLRGLAEHGLVEEALKGRRGRMRRLHLLLQMHMRRLAVACKAPGMLSLLLTNAIWQVTQVISGAQK